ncbi:BTAD domain-containing putative transcriptional regulator [Nonomuraea sp. NPDC050556]|uniref:AfsR/SARP family transcriptional regulator n=1 Tax=Nonomuraea sp. NPDC050556 TaxID=3364369 RepID=UPI0037A8A048
MSGLRFAVLGPVRAWRNGLELDVGAPQQRAFLALLLLRSNRIVLLADVLTALWGDAPPPSAVATVRTYASRLRRVLEPERGAGERPAIVLAADGGYLARVAPEAVDLHEFETKTAAAEQARAHDDPQEAARLLSAALDLWRGEPLAGVHTAFADAQRSWLSERRLAALEARIDAELAAGRHTEIIGELRTLVADEPLRERLRILLMTALYRSGRQAEALDAYAEARRVLVAELGIEPGSELRERHRQILAGELTSAPVPVLRPLRPTPAQLPPDIGDFTGRTAELKHLREILTAADPAALPVCVVSGMAGSGKTTIALHLAHSVREHFPDGQLYADLRGVADPCQVLGAFLRALGVPGESVPTGMGERAGLFRSLLADRRVLVVLDDASDAEQVKRLLPGSAGCSVLVTGRTRLLGLVADARVDLGVFPFEDALALFSRIAGAERTTVELQAAGEVVRHCGLLPLAVRVAAARLTARPTWTVSRLAGRLADASRRLEELRAVVAAFASGYERLEPELARAFRLLAVQREFSAPAAAATLGLPECRGEELCEALVDTGLLESPEPGRYRYHELLRLYATRDDEPGQGAGRLCLIR